MKHPVTCVRLLSESPLSPARGQDFLCAPFAHYCLKTFIYMHITIPEELEELHSLVSLSVVRDRYTKTQNLAFKW